MAQQYSPILIFLSFGRGHCDTAAQLPVRMAWQIREDEIERKHHHTFELRTTDHLFWGNRSLQVVPQKYATHILPSTFVR